MMTPTQVHTIPPISRAEAEANASTEYDRLVAALRDLGPDDWVQPTDCPGWDVRAVAGHCVGMMSDFTSSRAVARRLFAATRAARRNGGPLVDSMTAQQVAEQAHLGTDELITLAEQTAPRAAHWRAHAPALLRRASTTETVQGTPEKWRISYLLDTILTRDPWMHRVDIARATGRDMELTADHDGRIVADVVAEWARRHGQPFTLALTGPAGGEYTAGHAGKGEVITIDAVEFCRALSGRGPAEGLLSREVPF